MMKVNSKFFLFLFVIEKFPIDTFNTRKKFVERCLKKRRGTFLLFHILNILRKIYLIERIN